MILGGFVGMATVTADY